MIFGLAKKAAYRLANKGYIPLDDVDLIAYGFFAVLSKFIYGAICVISGFVFNRFVESIIFYISFLFVRKYAGGFHAKTELRCFFLSALSITISVLMISLSEKVIPVTIVVLCLSMISYIMISIYAPVPSKERPLNEEECKRYSNISKIRIMMLIAISLITYILEYKNICMSINTAVILSNFLLVAGKRKSKKYSVQNI